jgi:hypothetical protein
VRDPGDPELTKRMKGFVDAAVPNSDDTRVLATMLKERLK